MHMLTRERSYQRQCKKMGIGEGGGGMGRVKLHRQECFKWPLYQIGGKLKGEGDNLLAKRKMEIRKQKSNKKIVASTENNQHFTLQVPDISQDATFNDLIFVNIKSF